MDIKEFLQASNHFDSIGAFTVADELESEFVKIAQANVPEPRGSLGQGIYNTLDLFGRKVERGIGRTPLDYIPGTHGDINAFADWALKRKNEETNSNLKSVYDKLFNTLVKAKNSIITIAKKYDATYEYNPSFTPKFYESIPFYLKRQFIQQTNKRAKQLQINVEIARDLEGKRLDTVQDYFYNWLKKQKDIYNEAQFNSFLSILDSAAILISSITNPTLAKDISTGKVKPIPSKKPVLTEKPTATEKATTGVGDVSGTGKGKTTKITVKPSKFDVNDKLYAIVYSTVKSLRPSLSLLDMTAAYQNINSDSELKQAILEHIDSSGYSSENKAKLRDRFLKKVSGTYVPGPEPGPTPPEPTPPGPTPPSPTPSDQDVRPSPFLHDEVRKLSELDDREFMKVFESKSTILSRQIMSSYTNRVLLPEEYTYLIGAIDRMKLRFQKLLQGM